MTPKTLLRELARLTHDARARRMVDVGREAAGAADVAATLDRLERGAFFERYLAARSSFGSDDSGHVLRAIGDRSSVIRGLAIALAPIVLDDDECVRALRALEPAARLRLARRLRSRGRTAAVDRYLAEPDAGEVDERPALIAFASETTARPMAADALERARWIDWSRLASAHPALVAALLGDQVAAAAEVDPRLLRQVNAALPVLAERASDDALDVARAAAARTSLAQLDLQRLAERRPAQVADLSIAAEEPARVDFSRVAHRLGVERLSLLLRRQPAAVRLHERTFRRLAPVERGALFEHFGAGWRDGDGALPAWMVALLPGERRVREARRHLALPALASRDAQRMAYAAFLPWEEARVALEPSIRDPEAELRAPALAALIGVVRFERARAGEALASVRARRNEQDPVRLAMIGALRDLPPQIWRVEHLDPLGAILRDALDAADLSAGTSVAAQALVVRLLPHHRAWAAARLAELVRARGDVSAATELSRLPEDDARAAADALLPVLRGWETREREGHLVAFARGLGPRIDAFDGLMEIVARIVRDTRHPGVAAWGLSLIEARDRPRLTLLVPALLRGDRSWITQRVVHDYLHRRRQDLLTLFLGRRAYRGRFSTGKTRFVLPFMEGFGRSLPAQQETFAGTLGEVIQDRDRDLTSIQRAMRQIAAMPALDPSPLLALAGDDRDAVRDTALTALGRLDGGEGVPILVEALADDRARVAIYALRRAVLRMPPDRAIALLERAPMERVTVAKEVVRLLGDLRAEAAYRELLALDARDLHRDVRAALLRALWTYLERDETWPILERAASAGDPALAAVIGRIPAEGLSPDAGRRLAMLLVTVLERAEPRVRIAVLGRCGALPLAEARRILLPPVLDRVGSTLPEERRGAATAAFALAEAADADLIGAATRRLLADRRALVALVDAFEGTYVWQRGRHLPLARAILAAMEEDPLTATWRARLAVESLPWEELAAWLGDLAAEGLLHADVIAGVRAGLQRARGRWDIEELTILERSLAEGDDERLRRLGLAALVTLAEAPRGWDATRLEGLRAYRADPSPLVAGAAQFTLPPEESDAEAGA